MSAISSLRHLLRRGSTPASMLLLIGRLSPREVCLDLHLSPHASLGQGLNVLLVRDSLTLHWDGPVPELRETAGGLRQVLDSYLSAQAYYSTSSTKLQWTPTEWVEIPHGSNHRSIVGLLDPGLEHHQPDPRHPSNEPFRDAETLMPLVLTNQHLRFALRDYYQAWLTGGVDALFYGYRALEDLRQPFDRSERDKDWPAMHEAFGSDQESVRALTDVATAIRHGRQPTVTTPEWMAMMASVRRVIALAAARWSRDHELPTPKDPPEWPA